MTIKHLDQKHIQAGAALLALIAAGAAIALPLAAAYAAAVGKTSETGAHTARIDMLDERLQTERRAFTGELVEAGSLVRAYLSRGGKTQSASDSIEATCTQLANALSETNARVTSPCSVSQSPIGERFLLHAAEFSAQSAPDALLATADKAALEAATLSAFRLSTDDPTAKDTTGTLSVGLVEITANAEDAAE